MRRGGDKLIMYDWRCQSCDTKFDALAYSETYTSVCIKCGGESKRLVSAPRIDPRLGLDSESFPTMGDKWARKHEEQRRIEDKRFAEHGDDY